eukprot:3429188-Pyramimonas_sp.AAC.1
MKARHAPPPPRRLASDGWKPSGVCIFAFGIQQLRWSGNFRSRARSRFCRNAVDASRKEAMWVNDLTRRICRMDPCSASILTMLGMIINASSTKRANAVGDVRSGLSLLKSLQK